LTIAPLEIASPSPIHRKYSLPDGIADVRVHIEEREIGSPRSRWPIQISFENSTQ
jgi:hypothetical protein